MMTPEKLATIRSLALDILPLTGGLQTIITDDNKFCVVHRNNHDRVIATTDTMSAAEQLRSVLAAMPDLIAAVSR